MKAVIPTTAGMLPRPGMKFVAFYNDGSGVQLLRADEEGYLWDSEGNDASLDSVDRWIRVPDDTKFWYE